MDSKMFVLNMDVPKRDVIVFFVVRYSIQIKFLQINIQTTKPSFEGPPFSRVWFQFRS